MVHVRYHFSTKLLEEYGLIRAPNPTFGVGTGSFQVGQPARKPRLVGGGQPGQPANYEAIGDQLEGFGYGMKEEIPNKPPQNIMSRNLFPTSEREMAKLAIIPHVDPCQSPLLVSSPFCWYFVVSYIQTPIFAPEIPSGRGTARSFRRRQSDPQQLLWVSWQVVIAMAIVGGPPAGPVLRLQWFAATSSKPLCELTSSSATARKNGRLSVSEGS